MSYPIPRTIEPRPEGDQRPGFDSLILAADRRTLFVELQENPGHLDQVRVLIEADRVERTSEQKMKPVHLHSIRSRTSLLDFVGSETTELCSCLCRRSRLGGDVGRDDQRATRYPKRLLSDAQYRTNRQRRHGSLVVLLAVGLVRTFAQQLAARNDSQSTSFTRFFLPWKRRRNTWGR